MDKCMAECGANLPLANALEETRKNERTMNNERHQWQATSPHLVGRLTAEDTALILHFQVHDIPYLIKAGLLKPLGKPRKNTVKYFAATEIVAYGKDPVWLHKATAIINGIWVKRNAQRNKENLYEPVA